jgi:cytosine/adenosine deaminase-related metal-dependent hydrolase
LLLRRPQAVTMSAGTTQLDLTGHTVIPGIVGMHDHLFYIARPNLDARAHSEPPLMVPEMAFSAPRLYLANGVTTLRTTGSIREGCGSGGAEAIPPRPSTTSRMSRRCSRTASATTRLLLASVRGHYGEY